MDWMTKYDAKLVEVRMKIVRNILRDMWGVRIIFIIDCDKELYKTSFKTVRIAFNASFLYLCSLDFSLEILPSCYYFGFKSKFLLKFMMKSHDVLFCFKTTKMTF